MTYILFCLFNIICLWLLLKPFDFFSAFNIFIASFYLYYDLFFVSYLFRDSDIIYDASDVQMELIFVNLFMIGITAAKIAIKKRAVSGAEMHRPDFKIPSLHNILFCSYALIVFGCILYALFIHLAYGNLIYMLHLNRYDLFQKKIGLGSLFIGLYICFVGAIIRLSYYALYRKIRKQKFPIAVLLITIPLLLIQLLNLDRTNILFFFLPLLVVLLYTKPKLNHHLFYAVPVLCIVMELIAFHRLRGNDKFILFSEYYTPAKVDKQIFNNLDSIKIRYGGTYLDVLPNLPPAWITNNRPDLPPIWFVKKFWPEYYNKGGGKGFSIIAESLMNFYYSGPLIYGFLLGLFLLFIQRKLMGASFYYFVSYCIMQFYIFLIPRSGIAGLIKPALITAVIPFVFIWFISVWFNNKAGTNA